jgi:type VI protein secretion system component VasK
MPEEKRRIRTMARKDRTFKPPVRSPEEAERHAARLEHLCHLIVRDRRPYCPVNATLVVVPFAATDTDQDALDAGASCQRDLAVARQVLQVNSPTIVLVSDLETAPGFRAFLEAFPEKQRLQRVGQRCPLVPHLESRTKADEAPHAQMLEGLAEWVCGAVMPGWVYKHFRIEEPGQGDAAQVTRGNAQMFLFMHHLRERQHRLGRLLAQAFAADGDEPYLFGGCYLAGTGAESPQDQAFVAGVFQRLASEENHVSWTEQALEEEAVFRRWVAVGQTALGVLVLATLALAVVGFRQIGMGK